MITNFDYKIHKNKIENKIMKHICFKNFHVNILQVVICTFKKINRFKVD